MKRFKTLKDHVYDYITDQILMGELRPTEKINESEISEALSVSRTPVREALIQLSCEGILDNIPRKGFLLKSTSEKEARELYQVIGALDALSAVQSCPILTEKEYSAMEYHIQSMNFAITSDNYTLYLQHQDAFHNIYLDACSSEVLSDTLHRLKSRFFSRGHTKLSDPQNAPDLRMMNDEHREILRLFRERQGEALARYIQFTHWSSTHAHMEIF